MTNDAPERIVSIKTGIQPSDGSAGIWSDEKHHGGEGTKYIRADHAQAELQAAVAAAYEDAAECCTAELRNTDQLLSSPPKSSAAWDARNAIRARTDTDALEAVKAEARAKALREAAEEANEVAQARLSDERDTALACRDRILALIPTDQEENLND